MQGLPDLPPLSPGTRRPGLRAGIRWRPFHDAEGQTARWAVPVGPGPRVSWKKRWGMWEDPAEKG